MCQLGFFFFSDSAKRRQLPQRAPAREFWFRLGARGTAHDAALPTNVRASATFPGTTDGTFRAARVRLPRLFSGSAVSPASALAAAVASEHLEKLADQKHLETMPRVTEVSRVIAKSALIYPVAFSMHAYALLALPFSVSAALFRSLAGVSGKGMDELFASQFAPGGAGESDTALLRGLREKHKLAMAALHDQLDDSDSRYKVRSARGLSIAFSSRRFASSCRSAMTRDVALVSCSSFFAKNEFSRYFPSFVVLTTLLSPKHCTSRRPCTRSSASRSACATRCSSGLPRRRRS